MASNLALITYNEAKDILDLSNTEFDTNDNFVVDALIDAVTAAVEERIGAWVERPFDITISTPRPTTRVYLPSTDEQNPTWVAWPIRTVTSVIENGDPVDPSGYATGPWGVLTRRRSGFDVWWKTGRNNIRVVGTMGRVDATEQVPPVVKHVAAITLRHCWEQDRTVGQPLVEGAVSTPRAFSVPRRALDLVPKLVRTDGFA